MNDFKPGLIADVTMANGGTEETYGNCLWDSLNEEWVTAKSGRLYPGGVWTIKAVRPLAVIDPESDEDIESLRKLLNNSGAITGYVKGNFDLIRAALREFASPTPPKPEEPTGLGAVVEDAEGRRFVRVETNVLPWVTHDDDGSSIDYAEISAVRVLSEGVS